MGVIWFVALLYTAGSRKWFKIELGSQLITNRKSYMRFQLKQIHTTLSDPECQICCCHGYNVCIVTKQLTERPSYFTERYRQLSWVVKEVWCKIHRSSLKWEGQTVFFISRHSISHTLTGIWFFHWYEGFRFNQESITLSDTERYW